MVGVNAKRFKPSVAAVKERYFAKFRGGKDAANDDGVTMARSREHPLLARLAVHACRTSWRGAGGAREGFGLWGQGVGAGPGRAAGRVDPSNHGSESES